MSAQACIDFPCSDMPYISMSCQLNHISAYLGTSGIFFKYQNMVLNGEQNIIIICVRMG